MVDLSIDVNGIRFPNPFVLASGPPGTNGKVIRRSFELGWGGIVWQSPGNDWGDKTGGWNLSDATRLIVKARGEEGGEEVTFSFGLIGADKPFHDSAKGSTKVTLTREWQPYEISLAGKDLRRQLRESATA